MKPEEAGPKPIGGKRGLHWIGKQENDPPGSQLTILWVIQVVSLYNRLGIVVKRRQ
jgi:hypothetical protein